MFGGTLCSIGAHRAPYTIGRVMPAKTDLQR